MMHGTINIKTPYFFSLSKYRLVLKYKDTSQRDIIINSGGHMGDVSDKQPFFPSYDLCFTFNEINTGVLFYFYIVLS